MKKIINGKRYDTATAELMAEWSNNYSTSDFQYCSEELYRKKTGEYFLHGDGGAMSKYTTSLGENSWGGSEELMPLSIAEAQDWAEEHLGGDEYERIFGEVEEDKVQVGGFWVDRSLKARADALGCPQKDIFAAGIEAVERTQKL